MIAAICKNESPRRLSTKIQLTKVERDINRHKNYCNRAHWLKRLLWDVLGNGGYKICGSKNLEILPAALASARNLEKDYENEGYSGARIIVNLVDITSVIVTVSNSVIIITAV